MALAAINICVNADEMSSFTASNTNIQSGDDINLTMNYVVTKKYQLHLNAYNNQTNDELSPTFIAQDLKHVIYRVPDNVDYDIKIIASLFEDGSIVDSKELVLSTEKHVNSQADCPSWSIYNNGYCWAWASPCSGGCSTITFSRVPSGWRFATAAEWTKKPDKTAFTSTGNCASSYFDIRYGHCDWQNTPVYQYDSSYNELWTICDGDCK